MSQHTTTSNIFFSDDQRLLLPSQCQYYQDRTLPSKFRTRHPLIHSSSSSTEDRLGLVSFDGHTEFDSRKVPLRSVSSHRDIRSSKSLLSLFGTGGTARQPGFELSASRPVNLHQIANKAGSDCIGSSSSKRYHRSSTTLLDSLNRFSGLSSSKTHTRGSSGHLETGSIMLPTFGEQQLHHQR